MKRTLGVASVFAAVAPVAFAQQPLPPDVLTIDQCRLIPNAEVAVQCIFRRQEYDKELLINRQLQNDLLRLQIEREKQGQLAQPESAPRLDLTQQRAFKKWLAKNPWFGKNREQTEYASQYAKQLEKEQPQLQGGAFLDAVTAKVKDRFGTLAQ
jgi:hypothetical protein